MVAEGVASDAAVGSAGALGEPNLPPAVAAVFDFLPPQPPAAAVTATVTAATARNLDVDLMAFALFEGGGSWSRYGAPREAARRPEPLGQLELSQRTPFDNPDLGAAEGVRNQWFPYIRPAYYGDVPLTSRAGRRSGPGSAW